jgi:hypothetical protein
VLIAYQLSLSVVGIEDRKLVMKVDFIKGETSRYRSLLHRPDGVQVEFEGGSYNKLGGGKSVPHDIAHLIVEDELALTGGVWGARGRRG